MKTIHSLNLLRLLVAALLLLHLSACRHAKKEIPQADPAFVPYIAAFTSGIVSSSSVIRIRLTEPSAAFAGENQAAAEKLFSFSPEMSGRTTWIDSRTLEFRPDEPMEQDEVYAGKFFLDRVMQVDKKFAGFSFGFRIMKQALEVVPEGLILEDPANPGLYTFEGALNTADVIAEARPGEILTAQFNGKKMDISWINDPGGRHFSFRITGIERTGSEGSLLLAWNGKTIGVDDKGDLKIPVPARGLFIRTGERYAAEENALLISFSDPLDPAQDLRGIITTGNDAKVSYRIRSNILKVIFEEGFEGEFTMNASGSLRNTEGKSLGKDLGIRNPGVMVYSRKPQLRTLGTGCILPTSQGLIFPFEAICLKSVRVTIIRIFESNVAIFFQENELPGNNSMSRVGRPVFSQVIPLTNSGVTDFTKWNRFTLDLNRFIKTDPGAIYQVRITFGRSNIVYPCSGSPEGEEEITEEEYMQKLDNRWSEPGSYYFNDDDPGDDYGRFDWMQRDNPCDPTYYMYYENREKRMIRRNILATDIGLMLKRGSSGDALAVVTDIRTAKPMADAEIEVLDYQLQRLYLGKSNSDGMAEFRLERKPFLLVARKNDQRSYLRVDDASALSLSNFDVSGEEVQKGMKGYLFGERGVWRPGDSLFITFVLQDKQNVLPAGHPIVFELKNPSGQTVTRLVRSNDKSGMFSFRTATSPDAPTGKWNATVKAGGTLFSRIIRIETVKPNRLKLNFVINSNLPFGESGKIEAELHARWLHGGTAGNLKANYEVMLAKAKAAFRSWNNFTFDDPGVTITSEYMPVFNGRLDAEGNAAIRCDLKLEKRLPAALNAYFRGKVFEPGGDFSVDFLTVPVLPYDSYVGMRVEKPKGDHWLETGSDHRVYLATLDRKGNPLSISDLRVEIFRLRWSWWWQEEDGGDASYMESSYRKPVKSLTASTSNGKGSFSFRMEYPDWGRFLIRVTNPKNGQSCAEFVYVDWPSSFGRNDANIPGGATMLGLSADKSSCIAGEPVKITIPGMPGARALVSLENGSRVLKAYWIDAGKTENVEEIRTGKEMAPDVFIFVTVIQPHKDKKNDLPIRQYGVLSLDVEDPATVLTPVILMADELKPEQKFQVAVSEKNGKPMTYTLAVVDEGLLDLTHFKTPDPHEAFFAHEALGVKSFDLFDQIIGAYGGRLERLLSIGGDEIVKQEEKGKNLRFKPVVRFLGPFTLPAGGKTTHAILMPNYAGSVRVMVVAASADAYGFAEKTVPVRQEVMVMSTLPRVIRPGEEISMPVNVFVMGKSSRTVTVNVTPNKFLSVTGHSSKTISIEGEGDKVVYFRMKAANMLGMGRVDVVASSGTVRATCSVDLPVIHASQMIRKVSGYQVLPGRTEQLPLNTFGFPGTNTLSVGLSTLGEIRFSERISFLIQYPYGCAEQTTSAAMAQLALSKVVQLDESDLEQTEYNIRQAISRLAKFQAPSGGFLLWTTSYSPDDWITSYIGQFLLEAKKAGYSVPDYMIDRWKDYQRNSARQWNNDAGSKASQLVQAYRLYTLALTGSAVYGEMNRMKEIEGLIPQAAWRLALAIYLSGNKNIALGMVSSLSVSFPAFRDGNITYASNFRDQAMALEAMTEMGMADRAATLAKDVSDVVNSGKWLSTQECAWSFLSLSKYYKRFVTPRPVNAVLTLNRKESLLKMDKYSVIRSFSLTGSKNSLSVTNKSEAPLDVSVTESGIPVKDEDLSFRNRLNMTVSFQGRDGRPLDVSKLKQGAEFRVVVEVGCDLPEGCRNLALRQVFPSGWEISNMRLAGDSLMPGQGAAEFTYQDIRDDRVYTFFDLPRDRKKRFVLEMTAAYAGRFFFPGTCCEAMYDNAVGAKDKGMWVEVIQE